MKEIIFILCCSFHFGSAQNHGSQFVWNPSGIATYASPSLKSPVKDSLLYGDSVFVLEKLSDVEEVAFFEYELEYEIQTYTHKSHWYKILQNDEEVYILNANLLNIPVPIEVSLNHYFEQFSEIKNQKYMGQTDEFCSYELYEYTNGIHYSFTDFGPCEQCGHGVVEFFIPDLTVHQGLIFLIDFYNLQPDEIYFETVDEQIINFYRKYSKITIRKQKDGVLIIEDIML